MFYTRINGLKLIRDNVSLDIQMQYFHKPVTHSESMEI